MRKPRIAIILDENTSGDGTRYEAAKGYFRGVRDAGGLPFGIPYFAEVADVVLSEFDGLIAVGGRFAYPDDWYVDGEHSKAPPSERFVFERALVERWVSHDKPLLGICAGMQLLACIHGGKLTADLRTSIPDAIEHDRRGAVHTVTLRPGSQVAALVGNTTLEVNTFHREAVVHLAGPVIASGHAPDGVVEAVEIAGCRYAVGVQWHQELLDSPGHPGSALFRGLVDAA